MPPQVSESTSPFWSAYESAVKNILGDVEGNQVLFLRSFTQPWIVPEGESIPVEATNNYLHDLADVLLAADTGKEGASYFDELNSYLNWVDTGAVQNETTKKTLDNATTNFEKAKKKYEETHAAAEKEYEEEDPPKPPFERWAMTNYPNLAIDKSARDAAELAYNAAHKVYWGLTDQLNPYLQHMKDAQDSKNYHPMFNMQVKKPGLDLTYVPVYTAAGLNDQLNNWFEHGGQQKTFFKVKIESTIPPTAGNQGASNAGIYLEMSAKGLQKYDPLPGQWNVPGVKKLFPKLRQGAPKVLDSSFTRPVSFLLGYGVEVKMTIEGGDGGSKVSGDNDQAPAYPVVLAIVGQRL